MSPENTPTPRLADRLAAARRGRFVGRSREIDIFRSAMLADVSPFAVLFVNGPGGVGKSSLLREYARIAVAANRLVAEVDGRDIDPTPAGFLHALRAAIGLEGVADDPAPTLLNLAPNSVLIIDTFEVLAPLDSWLRETLLPALPARCLVVVAGRKAPALAWRTDLAWSDLTRVLSLNNLRPEESRTYLAARGIPDERQAGALAFTRGHPLALALVADLLKRGEDVTVGDPRAEPDIVRVLVERLVADVPTAEHRRALDVCTLARATTESLLADVLRIPDAHDLFEWLRDLPCVEHGPQGLFPHDLAREVLEADLRWRDPIASQRLSGRVYVTLTRRVAIAPEHERQRLQLDALFAARTQPSVSAYFDWSMSNEFYAGSLGPTDAEAVIEMVQRHEGAASAAIARYWLSRQPQAFRVLRQADGESFVFLAHLELGQVSEEDRAVDPAIESALALVQQYGPAAPGEVVLYLRFWMHQEQYQAVTPAINLTVITLTVGCMTHPRLAWNFFAMADPDFWRPHIDAANIPRAPQADFKVGGRRYGVFAHDWRVEPASAWQVGPPTPMPFLAPYRDTRQAHPAEVLASEEFSAAVRQALRDHTRPDRLAANPLLRSPLFGAGQVEAGPEALRTMLRDAAATLLGNPRDVKFHRAVWHTYFEPAPTQEQAAELLDLPFTTYRYRLAVGVERISDYLRQQEQHALGR
jgi:hypothetical protein